MYENTAKDMELTLPIQSIHIKRCIDNTILLWVRNYNTYSNTKSNDIGNDLWGLLRSWKETLQPDIEDIPDISDKKIQYEYIMEKIKWYECNM